MATMKMPMAVGTGSGGKVFAIISNGGGNGGAYTLFNKDGSLNKTVKLPYDTSTTPVNDDYCTITGTKTSDTLTFNKACTTYTNTQSTASAKPFYPLDTQATVAAGTVISNTYTNMHYIVAVFDD